jgi:ParB family chromosome partitioning protein
MTITPIALENLKLSPQNVRKSFSKSGIDEMKASILAHGLLDNLIVTEADDGMYHVVGGGRRLIAMHALIKEGSLPKGHTVPCKIVDDANASELSLAENTVREAMHPADEFEAFAALAKDHVPAEIALRFGVTEAHVLKRLKLGRVAPEIMEAYRRDKLNLESMMAFTLTDDHAVQRKIYKAVKDNPHAHSIRRMLIDKKVGSKDKLVRFVGLEAYQQAGGKITGDLFNAEQYLDDPALLEELAAGKLKALEEKLKAEGWEWVHVALENEYGFTHKYGRIEAKQVRPPKELAQKHAKLAKECDKLENQLRDMDDGDPRYNELDAKSDEMVVQLEALETELDGYNKFNPEQMKNAGVYARLDHDGKLLIDRGLVTKAAEKKIEGEKSGKKAEPKEKASRNR